MKKAWGNASSASNSDAKPVSLSEPNIAPSSSSSSGGFGPSLGQSLKIAQPGSQGGRGGREGGGQGTAMVFNGGGGGGGTNRNSNSNNNSNNSHSSSHNNINNNYYNSNSNSFSNSNSSRHSASSGHGSGGGGGGGGGGDGGMKSLHREQPDIPYSYGNIVSLKDAFGFIQCNDSSMQVYFSFRDLNNMNVAIGDEVSFLHRLGKQGKGPYAERVRVLSARERVEITNLTGFVVEDALPKGAPGRIQIKEQLATEHAAFKNALDSGDLVFPHRKGEVTYHWVDMEAGSPTGRQSKARLIAGDEVTFSLFFYRQIPSCRAAAIKLIRTKADRKLDGQIQGLIDSGLKSSRGVVANLIKSSDYHYGFIQSAEKDVEIFFKCDDLTLDEGVEAKEGMEVEFFVIQELVKGKMSDRAVFVRLLPPGSVQLIVPVASRRLGVVVTDPESFSSASYSGKIGELKLFEKLTFASGRDGTSMIEVHSVDLTAKMCVLPHRIDTGDVLEVDVVYFSSRNAFIATAATLKSFSFIDREYGVIATLKDNRYGFFTSFSRESDVYFNASDIVMSGLTSLDQLGGRIISFNIVDERSTPDAKLKAERIAPVPTAIEAALFGEKSLDDIPKSIYSTEVARSDLFHLDIKGSNSKKATLAAIRFQPLRMNCVGTITRDLMKRTETVGVISLSNEESDSSSFASSGAASASQFSREVVFAINNFSQFATATGVQRFKFSANLTAGQRRSYHTALAKLHPSIKSETITTHAIGVGLDEGVRNLVVSTSSSSSSSSTSSSSSLTSSSPSSSQVSGGAVLPPQPPPTATTAAGPVFEKSIIDTSNEVFYDGASTISKYGPLTRLLDVSFDLYLDKNTNKRIAKNVCLTDQAVAMPADHAFLINEFSFGVVDKLTQSPNGNYGYIRCIPSDQKLFWHSATVLFGQGANSLNIGGEVLFRLRGRGGVLSAVDIFALPTGCAFSEGFGETLKTVNLTHAAVKAAYDGFTFAKVHISTGSCVAVVCGDGNSAIVLDPANSPLLMNKYYSSLSDTPSSSSSPISASPSASAGGGGGDNSDLLDAKKKRLRAFPLLPRTPVPIMVDFFKSSGKALVAGDIIICKAAFQMTVQRHPLYLSQASKLVDYTTVMRTGTIANIESPTASSAVQCKIISIQLQDTAAVTSSASSNATTATTNTTNTSSRPASPIYYCLSEELQTLPMSTSAAPNTPQFQVGDVVEFLSVSDSSPGTAFSAVAGTLAISPKVIRAAAPPVVKSFLNLAPGGSSTLSAIVVAKGPPTEAQTGGFSKGWRGYQPDTTNLPWRALLACDS